MKWRNVLIIMVTLLAASLLYIASDCGGNGKNLPQEVRDMLTDEQIDQLGQDGLDIYEGSNPPNVEGVYLGDSQYCVYSSDGYQDWYTFEYWYNFMDQSGQTLTVAYNGGPGEDISEGDLAYISGNANTNNFSIFVETHGVYLGVSYTMVIVYSGTIASDGIHDFQYGFIMTYKSDDPSGYMMEVGHDRIFIEDDYLAERSTWPSSASDSVPLSSIQGLPRHAAP